MHLCSEPSYEDRSEVKPLKDTKPTDRNPHLKKVTKKKEKTKATEPAGKEEEIDYEELQEFLSEVDWDIL